MISTFSPFNLDRSRCNQGGLKLEAWFRSKTPLNGLTWSDCDLKVTGDSVIEQKLEMVLDQLRLRAWDESASFSAKLSFTTTKTKFNFSETLGKVFLCSGSNLWLWRDIIVGIAIARWIPICLGPVYYK